MDETKNKTIKETFRSKLKTPWVWIVVALTVGLTVLFSLSQKPQMVMYSQDIKSLSDFQLLDARLSKDMERARSGYGLDTMKILSETMTLREMAVSFARQMDELQGFGFKRPSSASVSRFEREVLGKVSAARRYLSIRTQWLKSWQQLSYGVNGLPDNQEYVVRELLDSARAGFPVRIPEGLGLPDTLYYQLDMLLNINLDLSVAWTRFDSDVAMLNSEELIQFFQMERLNEIALNAKIPLVFYFLTLVLLLSTFFFMFRSKQ